MCEKICLEYGVNVEQAKALDIESNTALRAGAGSGKTRVTTKRFVRLLLEKPDIELDNIVAITFTRKAAAEMKYRIRKEISERLEKSTDPEEQKRLTEIRLMISLANIDTIHGFCSRIIRDNYAWLGIDPDFSIMEEVDSRLKLTEVTDNLISEYVSLNSNSKDFQLVMEGYGSSMITSGSLRDGIIELYKSIREKGLHTSEIRKLSYNLNGNETTEALERIAAELLILLDEKYNNYKNENNLLDFNDLEILTVKLLGNKNIQSYYHERYKYFLIDEFQDVNPLQKLIVDGLTKKEGKIPKGRLFIVGDHKQSIYGFRGADYRVFDQTCNEIESCGDVRKLSTCYRSTRNIIDAVNNIFSKLIDPFEELEFPGNNQNEEKKVELITWEKDDVTNKIESRWDATKKLLAEDINCEEFKEALSRIYDTGEKTSKKDYQGEIIASRIQSLLKEGFRYKDFAVLMRSRTNLKCIENALSGKEIPYSVLGGLGFWDRQEVNDIIALYKLIFSPQDKISLMTVLRSPIFGFSDDLILSYANIYNNCQQSSIISMLKMLESNSTENEKWIIERTEQIMEKLLPLDGIENAEVLMNTIVQAIDYDNILLSLPEGEKKYRNLEKLLKIIEDFEGKGIYAARELPSYLYTLSDTSALEGEAFLDSEDSDAVKILTIHASKGLEFPAVIIPDMDSQLDAVAKRYKTLFFFNPEKGIVAIGLGENLERNSDANPDYAEIYNYKLKKEIQDSIRVFYVAATRAERYLAFVGESQEIKANTELYEQNSFMKQLMWALDNIGEIESLVRVNGYELIDEIKKKQEYFPLPSFEELGTLVLNNKNMYVPNIDMLDLIESFPKGILSVSMWLKYKDCPRGYYYSYIAGLDVLEEYDPEGSTLETDNEGGFNYDAAELGTAVHKALEELDIGSGNYDNVGVGSVNGSYIDNIDLVKRYVDNFIKLEKAKANSRKGRLVKTLKEYKFRVPISESLSLAGIIDRIDIYENNGRLEAYIIDYKTNRINDPIEAEKKAEYYKDQLILYAYAVSKLPILHSRNVMVKGTELYFLSIGHSIELDNLSENENAIISELVNISPWLLGKESACEYKPNVSDACKWCSYKNICDVYM